MPIAAIPPDYDETHWQRVRQVLSRAVNRAGMQPQPVWEQSSSDVIQSRIIQNLYENEVVVCDVSGLNPNVMLELGMRLSTKKPTVIVSDGLKKPPFDTGVIEHLFYSQNLEYNATDEFIDRLASRIKEVSSASKAGEYKSFVENFTFETVKPSTVAVEAERYFAERLEELTAAVQRLDRRVARPASLNAGRDSEVLAKGLSENIFATTKTANALRGSRVKVDLIGPDPEKLSSYADLIASRLGSYGWSISQSDHGITVDFRLSPGHQPSVQEFSAAIADLQDVSIGRVRFG